MYRMTSIKTLMKEKEDTSKCRTTPCLHVWILLWCQLPPNRGLPGSSAGKGSAWNAGYPGLIPGLGRSPGEVTDYPPQYSWASLVAEMLENLPAMQETWVQSLAWKDPLEEGLATRSRILAWRIPMDRGAWQDTVHGVTKSGTRLSD